MPTTPPLAAVPRTCLLNYFLTLLVQKRRDISTPSTLCLIFARTTGLLIL